MARKKSPGDAVQFTLESAQRIASVVRTAEQTPSPTAPLSFARLIGDRPPKLVRAATFSGSWPISSQKVVTFSNAPTATANVLNLSWPITEQGYVNEPCIVGKDGTAWYLVVPVLQQQNAVFVTATQSSAVAAGFTTINVVQDVALAATLNTLNCVITVGKTLSTSQVTVVSATAVGIAVVGTTASAFLRLRVP